MLIPRLTDHQKSIYLLLALGILLSACATHPEWPERALIEKEIIADSIAFSEALAPMVETPSRTWRGLVERPPGREPGYPDGAPRGLPDA